MKIATTLIILTALLGSPHQDQQTIVGPSTATGPHLPDKGPVIFQETFSVLQNPGVVQDSLAPARSPVTGSTVILDEHFSAPAANVAPSIVHVPQVPVLPATVCTKCECKVCCCKPKQPKKQKATFCLQDPRGCTHDACVKVPACCVGEAPNVQWSRGLLGRQIARLCWNCCDHEVKVIVTRRGKVKVRD